MATAFLIDSRDMRYAHMAMSLDVMQFLTVFSLQFPRGRVSLRQPIQVDAIRHGRFDFDSINWQLCIGIDSNASPSMVGPAITICLQLSSVWWVWSNRFMQMMAIDSNWSDSSSDSIGGCEFRSCVARVESKSLSNCISFPIVDCRRFFVEIWFRKSFYLGLFL